MTSKELPKPHELEAGGFVFWFEYVKQNHLAWSVVGGYITHTSPPNLSPSIMPSQIYDVVSGEYVTESERDYQSRKLSWIAAEAVIAKTKEKYDEQSASFIRWIQSCIGPRLSSSLGANAADWQSLINAKDFIGIISHLRVLCDKSATTNSMGALTISEQLRTMSLSGDYARWPDFIYRYEIIMQMLDIKKNNPFDRNPTQATEWLHESMEPGYEDFRDVLKHYLTDEQREKPRELLAELKRHYQLDMVRVDRNDYARSIYTRVAVVDTKKGSKSDIVKANVIKTVEPEPTKKLSGKAKAETNKSEDNAEDWTCSTKNCLSFGEWHPRGKHIFPKKCQICDEKGHTAKECPTYECKKKASAKVSFVALMEGALVDTDDSDYEDIIAKKVNCCGDCCIITDSTSCRCDICDSHDEQPVFILDSGCIGGSVVNDAALLSDVQTTKRTLQLGDGRVIISTEVGRLPCVDHVFVNTAMSGNLLSTSQLCQQNGLHIVENGVTVNIYRSANNELLTNVRFVKGRGYVVTLQQLSILSGLLDSNLHVQDAYKRIHSPLQHESLPEATKGIGTKEYDIGATQSVTQRLDTEAILANHDLVVSTTVSKAKQRSSDTSVVALEHVADQEPEILVVDQLIKVVIPTKPHYNPSEPQPVDSAILWQKEMVTTSWEYDELVSKGAVDPVIIVMGITSDVVPLVQSPIGMTRCLNLQPEDILSNKDPTVTETIQEGEPLMWHDEFTNVKPMVVESPMVAEPKSEIFAEVFMEHHDALRMHGQVNSVELPYGNFIMNVFLKICETVVKFVLYTGFMLYGGDPSALVRMSRIEHGYEDKIYLMTVMDSYYGLEECISTRYLDELWKKVVNSELPQMYSPTTGKMAGKTRNELPAQSSA